MRYETWDLILDQYIILVWQSAYLCWWFSGGFPISHGREILDELVHCICYHLSHWMWRLKTSYILSKFISHIMSCDTNSVGPAHPVRCILLQLPDVTLWIMTPKSLKRVQVETLTLKKKELMTIKHHLLKLGNNHTHIHMMELYRIILKASFILFAWFTTTKNKVFGIKEFEMCDKTEWEFAISHAVYGRCQTTLQAYIKQHVRLGEDHDSAFT